MVRLLRPGHQEERLRRIAVDELVHAVDRAAVLHAPGRQQRRARQLVVIDHVAEAAAIEKCPPVGPVEIARRDKGGPVAAVAEHRGDRRARQPRVLFGEIAEVELGEGRQQNRRQRVRAAPDVRVEVVEHDAARRFCRRFGVESYGPWFRPAPPRRHRLEHEQNHVRRTPRREQARAAARLRQRTSHQGLPQRREVGEILGGERARHPHRRRCPATTTRATPTARSRPPADRASSSTRA